MIILHKHLFIRNINFRITVSLIFAKKAIPRVRSYSSFEKNYGSLITPFSSKRNRGTFLCHSLRIFLPSRSMLSRLSHTKLFSQAFKTYENIIKFVKRQYYRKLLINDFSLKNDENYVYDENYKYYLSIHDWNTLFKNLYHKDIDDTVNNYDISKNQELSRLSELKSKIQEVFQPKAKKHSNRQYFKKHSIDDALDLMIKTIDMKYLPDVIYMTLEDSITNHLIQKESSDDFKFKISQTKLGVSFGQAIFETYFDALQDYKSFLFSEKKEKVEALINIFFQIFEILDKKSVELNDEDYDALVEDFQTYFNLSITNPLLMALLIRKLFLLIVDNFGLYGKKKYKCLTDIELILLEKGMSTLKIDVMKREISFQLTEYYLKFGCLVIDLLSDYQILDIILDNEYKSDYMSKKTTRMVTIQSEIVYYLQLNASSFKPFLIYDNKYLNQETVRNLNDFKIRFKSTKINEEIHQNFTGYGQFSRNNPILKDPHFSSIKLCIDNDLLFNILTILDDISGKNYKSFITEEQKTFLYAFLSIYGINFQETLKNLSEEYISIYEKIIEFAIDIQEKPDYQQFEYLFNQINEIKNRSVKEQLKTNLNKIRAYKSVIIFAIRDYIIYSCFNHFIVPSYYDFRGRRYFNSITFNPQSYPFLKAFLKIYEPNIATISIDNFNSIKEAIISQIQDNTLKHQVEVKMSDLTNYKKTILLEKINFIYSHINSEKMTMESFKEFFLEPNTDFKYIYNKVFNIIKNTAKTIIITSFILLEKMNVNNNIRYSNHYSYDMVTSGYQMTAMLFPDKNLGKMTNLIGNDRFDLYQHLGDYQKIAFNKVIELYTNFMNNIYSIDKIENDSNLKNSLLHCNTIFESFMKSKIDYNKVLNSLYQNKYLCDYCILLEEQSIVEDKFFILFPEDKNYVDKLSKYSQKLAKNLLTLGRLYCLNNILEKNKWLIDKKIIGSRALVKHIIMIEIYGGTRRGRERVYDNFIEETCMDLGLTFNVYKNKALLFYYVEFFYNIYKKEHLSQAENLITLSKWLSEIIKEPINIKNTVFEWKLHPIEYKKGNRIYIGVSRRRLNRKSYQLCLNRPHISNFSRLTDCQVIINKKKMASLFPPDFIHSMDAYLVHIIMDKINNISHLLYRYFIRFNLVSIHDNFSCGSILFPIMPEIIIDAIKMLFDYKYLITLSDNFQTQEEKQKFNQFLKTLKPKDPFTNQDINNPNMIKYG